MITYEGKDWSVCAVTPAGRAKHMAILKKYIYREMRSGLIDHWQLWKNTGVPEDVAYLESMVVENDQVELVDIGVHEYNPYNIQKFYNYTTDENTIYLRFDDDIVWMDETAIEALVKTRLEHPEAFVVSANIVNNTLIGWIHQSIGVSDTAFGTLSFQRLDEVGWRNPEYAEYMHTNFIRKYGEEELNQYMFPFWKLIGYNAFSISCFAYFGFDLQPIDNPDEELWISEIRPRAMNRPCLIDGTALVVHYGYHTQRALLDQKPYILDFYRDLCEKV